MYKRQIYTSAAEAAAKVGGKVIGVDVDQAGIIDGGYGEGMTVTSAMKGLAPTVEHILLSLIHIWPSVSRQEQGRSYSCASCAAA